jgi:serine/threonine-protein kinase
VLSAEEAAAAETRLIEEDALAEDMESSSASSATGGSVDGATSGEPATRVLEESNFPDHSSGSDGQLAETELVEEVDKTMPPPVNTAAGQVASPARSIAIENAETSLPDRGLIPGTVLFGEYEIVNVLGVGGMGEVYRAKHRRLEEHRAIKVMHAELSKKKGASKFFYREAKALLAVRHPAVVHCNDLLSDDEGRVYLIMEMIEGIPLSKKMEEGPLSPEDVAILGARVAHGLTAAHRKGVIHRDLSPDNIVLPNGNLRDAKIIDFGIAKILEEGEGTIIDGFKGKLTYASPEQLGFFGGKLDGRSDFYSLGLMLVAAFQGSPMEMGTTVVEAVDARRSLQTLPPEIPIELRSAIEPLLALDPKDRPTDVDQLFMSSVSRDLGLSRSAGLQREGGRGAAEGSRLGLFSAIGAIVAIVLGAGLYLSLGVPGAPEGKIPGTPSDATARPNSAEFRESPLAPAEAPIIAEAAPPPIVVEEPPPPPAVAQAPEPTPIAAPTPPAKPVKRRISASDRIKIIGLISNAKLALSEDRLMLPADDNAYDRYRRVLALDPDNQRAKAGLFEVSDRYVRKADQAVKDGRLDQARLFVNSAKLAAPSNPGIALVESQFAE